MLAMGSAFGIPALRTMFTAARLLQAWAPAAFRRPLASRAAAACPPSTTLAAAITLAPAGSIGQSSAALRLSMVSEAAARVFMALAAPEDFMAAAVEPSQSGDTAAAAIAELLPGYAR